IPANNPVLQSDPLYALKAYTGDTYFGTGPTQCKCGGANLGQEAASAYVGGDGGIGGTCATDGLYLMTYIQGGLGQASAPLGTSAQGLGLNLSHPIGGPGARGGSGGINGQCGTTPGGGGAPGNNDTSITSPAMYYATFISIASSGSGYAIGDLI